MFDSTPLRLRIPVEWTNVPEDIDPTWLISTLEVNITLEHSWSAVREALWRSSQSYFLKPMFIKLYFNGTQVPDLTPFSQLWSDIVDISNLQDWADCVDSLKAVVDLTLIHNPAIPKRDPVEEWFDVCIHWMGREINLRETLNSTISSLKEQILDADSYNIVMYSPLFVKQRDDNQSLRELLQLDVIPLQKVSLLAAPIYPLAVETVVIKVGTVHLHGLPNNFTFPRLTTCKEVDSLIRARANLDLDAKAEFSFNSNPFEADSKAPFLDMLKNATLTGGHYIVQYKIDIEQPECPPQATRTQPQEPKLRAPMEPMRIIVGPDLEWRLTGETYEYVEANRTNPAGRQVLVKQTELNPVKHHFKYQNLEETLGHNQCLIVDNGMHQPYALINQSGISKLHRKFKDDNGETMLQQVVVETYDSNRRAPEPIWDAEVRRNHPQTYGDLYPLREAAEPVGAEAEPAAAAGQGQARPLGILIQMAAANVRHIGTRFFHVGLIIYFTGLLNPILTYPMFFIFFSSFSISLYILFASGDRISGWIENNLLEGQDEARLDSKFLRLLVSTLEYTNYASVAIGVVLEELVNIAIRRRFEFEYVIDEDSNQTGWWYWISDWFTNLWKDILVYFLVLIPSAFIHIERQKNWMFDNEYDYMERAERQLRTQVIASIELYKVHRERAGNAIEREPEEILEQLMALNLSQGQRIGIDSKLEPELVGESESESGTTTEIDGVAALNETEEVDDFEVDELRYQTKLKQYRQLHFVKRIILQKLVNQG